MASAIFIKPDDDVGEIARINSFPLSNRLLFSSSYARAYGILHAWRGISAATEGRGLFLAACELYGGLIFTRTIRDTLFRGINRHYGSAGIGMRLVSRVRCTS